MSQPVKYIRTCSIWRALEIVGDKPTLLIIESYWFGMRRFNQFQKQTGLIKTVVNDRLQKLITSGCMKKVLYSDSPQRYEYRATEKFLDFYPIGLAMLHWERKWSATPDKVDVQMTHKTCGQITDPKPICGGCAASVDPRDVDWRDGPGIGLMPATYNRRRRQARPSREAPTALFDAIIEVIGDRWSALIILSLFTGRNKFQEIEDDTGMAPNILSGRLVELTRTGFIRKRAVDSGRAQYRLTEKGRDIYPVILALMIWGDRWVPAAEGPPVILSHRPCEADLKMIMACSACEAEVKLGDVDVVVTLRDSPADQMMAS